MRVSSLETLDGRSSLGHVLILVFRSESVTDRVEFRPIVYNIILVEGDDKLF